jgi:hypothetical protein
MNMINHTGNGLGWSSESVAWESENFNNRVADLLRLAL